MSTVRVKIWDTTVGYLSWDEPNNRSIFELEEEYIDADFNLSPILLPKTRRIISGPVYNELFKALPPMIADSLPDHFGNRVFLEWLEKNAYSQDDLNPVERLMYIASRGPGALEYEPAKSAATELENIDFRELSEISTRIIEQKYSLKEFRANKEALQHILSIGSSVGGAQAKVLVAKEKSSGILKAGDVMQGAGHDYYIVKLAQDSSTWGREKNFVEYAYYQMAKDAGLHIAESELIEEDGLTHFWTKRFDRIDDKKIHMQSLSALTGYSDKSLLYSYEELFMVAERLSISHTDKENLYRQLIFNVVFMNMDDHMKNFSFLMDSDGKWKLSPPYDLTYPFDTSLPAMKAHKMSINGKVKGIDRNDLLTIGKRVGIRNAPSYLEDVLVVAEKAEEYLGEHPISEHSKEIILADVNKKLAELKA